MKTAPTSKPLHTATTEKRRVGKTEPPASRPRVSASSWANLPFCQSGLAVKADDQNAAIGGHRCKRWSCEYCNPLNRRMVIAHAVEGRPRRLLTLTVSSKNYETPDEAAQALKRGLRLLRLRLKRHPRLANFPFLAVFEAHESGYPHLHLLIRGKFLPWRWLRMAWEEITGSTGIDIRAIKGGRDAARYVAKYLGKDLHAFEGCKRWWRSHSYDLPKDDEQDSNHARQRWIHFRLTLPEAAEALAKAGWELRKAGPNGIRAMHATDPPERVAAVFHDLLIDRRRRQPVLNQTGQHE